jgi:histidinol-phosphate aminotransferase
MALAAAEAALDDVEFINKSRELNSVGMRQLVQFFEKSGLKYISSAGNFISVYVGQDAISVYKKLLQLGVIVRPVENYNMAGYLRITIGTKKENDKFITSLQKILSNTGQ